MRNFPSRRLYTSRTTRRPLLRPFPGAYGQFTKYSAHFFGTGSYLLIQTIVVVVWIKLNVNAIHHLEWQHWDKPPFNWLNLAFSTQAAFAAPLILAAQNRQEKRDRVVTKEDRRSASQTKADIEYLARELAAVRLAVTEVPTREYLRHELDDLRALLADRLPENPGTEPGADG
ncbi:MAG: DUF1003 domain-containing protein [Mycobacterium sp.]